MFKKYYKEAFDDVQPNRELIGRIFDEAEKSKKSKTAVIYKYGMAFAAVFVLAVSAYSYPKIIEYAKTDADKVSTIELVAENPSADIEIVEKKESTEKSKPILKEALSSTESVKNSNVKESVHDVNVSDNISEVNNKAIEMDSNIIFDASEEVSDTVQKDMTETETVNATAESEEKASGGGGAASSKMREGNETVLWSMEKYAEYLEINILENVSIPSGMKSTTPDTVYVAVKNGQIVNDLMTFCFLGENKTVLIETAKKADVFFDVSSECEVKVFDNILVKMLKKETNETDAYFEYNGVKFRVYSLGITDNEFEDIISSVTTPK